MLERAIRILWGDTNSILGLARLATKLVISFFLAVAIHEWIFIPLFTGVKESERNEVMALAKKISENENIKKLKVTVDISFGQPQKACAMPPAGATWKPVFTFTILKEGGGCIPGAFAINGHLGVPLISNPKVVDSTHTFLRKLEKVAFGQQNQTTTDLRLCAGTRKLLEDVQCAHIAQATGDFVARVEQVLKKFQFASLVLGTIQAVTLAVFIFILIEAVGLWLRYVAPLPVFFTLAPKGDDAGAAIHIKQPEEFAAATQAYEKAVRRSVGDRLLARTMLGLDVHDKVAAGGQQGMDEEHRRSKDTLYTAAESYREFLESEAEGALQPLETANETMLKLAFIGTIWGIGDALFSSRNLETMDPVEKVITKSDMFSGIGTAFGTTLVGVVLSILAASMVQLVGSAWQGRINRYFGVILNLGFDRIVESVTSLPADAKERLKPKRRPPQRIDGSIDRMLGRIGRWTIGLIVVILLLVVAFASRDKIAMFIARILDN